MIKKLVHLLVVVCLLATPVVSIAQEVPDRYAGREHIKIDHEALKAMTREEKRAYMQAYKQAREDEARRAGITPKTGGGYVPLETPRKVEERQARVPGSNITYDTGTVSGTAGMASQMLGNRFDSALNPANGTMCCFPVETSGSITMITFDMVTTFFGSAVWSLYSNVSGATAMRVTSMGRGVGGGLNTLSVMSPTTANAYMNGTFLAGIFQFMPASTGLAVDTGSLLGQGFHAININDGTTGTALTNVTTGGGGGLNAIFRVSGNVATTPVELMRFEIEE